jgi:hypothetical protein
VIRRFRATSPDPLRGPHGRRSLSFGPGPCVIFGIGDNHTAGGGVLVRTQLIDESTATTQSSSPAAPASALT